MAGEAAAELNVARHRIEELELERAALAAEMGEARAQVGVGARTCVCVCICVRPVPLAAMADWHPATFQEMQLAVRMSEIDVVVLLQFTSRGYGGNCIGDNAYVAVRWAAINRIGGIFRRSIPPLLGHQKGGGASDSYGHHSLSYRRRAQNKLAYRDILHAQATLAPPNGALCRLRH